MGKIKEFIKRSDCAQYMVGATIGTVIGVALLKIWHSGYTTGHAAGIDYDMGKVNDLIKEGTLLWADQVSGDTNRDPAKADPSLINIRTAL